MWRAAACKRMSSAGSESLAKREETFVAYHHTSALVSIRQHTSAYDRVAGDKRRDVRRLPAYVSICQHTIESLSSVRNFETGDVRRLPAYVSIRQHTIESLSSVRNFETGDVRRLPEPFPSAFVLLLQ